MINNIIKIGYQGIEGSNSEQTSKTFSQKLFSGKKVEFVPLVTSQNVVNKLIAKEIDYGVMAFENNIGGIVEETRLALENLNYKIIQKLKLDIHHCLFVKNKSIDTTKVTKIISHEQALKQCSNFIAKNFPTIQTQKAEDTAICAEMLKNGILPDSTAIICRKNAGENRGLRLLAENIENQKSITEFYLIQKQKYVINRLSTMLEKRAN